MKEVTIDRVRSRIAHIESLNARGVGTKVEQQQFELACLRELLELLALRERAEPVAEVCEGFNLRYIGHGPAPKSGLRIGAKLYTAPPAPVVPEAIENAIEYIKSIAFHIDENDYHGQHIAHFMQQAIMWLEGDACRAAMLTQPTKANNVIGQFQRADGALHNIVTLGRTACKDEPVSQPYKLPDGWIKCSERMPGRDGGYLTWDGRNVSNTPFFFGSWQANQFIARNITHWMPLPAAPDKEK